VDAVDGGDGGGGEAKRSYGERWPVLVQHPGALDWLRIQSDLGMSPRTIEAYGRALADYLTVCQREGIEPLTANRSAVARYVCELLERPNRRGGKVVAIGSGVGLANATLQQRLVAVRLFYDHLIEEGLRDTNPVGRGRFTPGKAFGDKAQRGLLPRFTKLPWIPTDDQWQEILKVTKEEPIRNRLMLALATMPGCAERSCAC
jgi:integrase/recombinase XerD